MAEAKQYVTIARDNGSVMISEDVIVKIAAHAAGEVEGVVAFNKPGTDIAEFISGKNRKRGIKVSVNGKGALTVDCNIVIYFGNSVVEVAKAVQEAVSNAVSSVTGVDAAAVNVNVCGVIRQ